MKKQRKTKAGIVTIMLAVLLCLPIVALAGSLGAKGAGPNTVVLGNDDIVTTKLKGNVAIPGNLTVTGTLTGKLATLATSNTDFVIPTAICSGGILHMTAGGTGELPVAVVGMSLMVKSTTTAVAHVIPNGSDIVVLNGTALTTGYGVKSPGSVAGEYITFYCVEANKWETMGNPCLFVDNGGELP